MEVFFNQKMENITFIVNPIAGANTSLKRFDALKAFIIEHGVPYSVKYTEYSGHASVLATEAFERGEKNIVSVGGDGTFREIASVLFNKPVSLGILPFGTGNDLARALHIPFLGKDALDIIYRGKTRSMDLGQANGEFFTNIAGFGFDTQVLENTQKFKGRFKGMFPYLLGVFKAFWHLTPIQMKISAANKIIKLNAVLIAVGNGTHFGGGMMVTPKADPFDGLFDVCVVHAVNRLTFLRLFPSFIKGNSDAMPIEYFRTSWVSVKCEGRSYSLNLDGELQNQTPVLIKILPGALNVFIGED
ncbi:MAG: diacylglycerol kinase family lipid kinase [Clostridia bacterium]